MKTISLVLLTFLFGAASCAAQSPAGSWKRINSIVVDANGTKSDIHKMMASSIPCTATMVYRFLPDGKMQTIAEGCPDVVKTTAKAADAISRWKVSGNKMTVTTTNNELPPAAWVLSYQGNTMTQSFHFSENPKTPNPMKSKSVIVVFQRVK